MSFCFAPSGLGWPLLWFFGSRSPPPFFFFLLFRLPRAPLVSFFLWFPVPGALGLGALFLFPPPLPACVFFPRLRPRRLWLTVVSGPGALGLGAVCCLFCWPPAPRLFVRSGLFCVSRLAVGCSLVVASPAPPCFVSHCFSRCCSVLRFFCFSRCASPLSLAFVGFSPRVPWALALCAFRFVGLPLLGSSCAVASFVVPAWPLAAPWWLLPPPPPLLCLAVFLAAALCSVLFFFFFVFSFSLRAPVVSGFLWFPAPDALFLGACLLFLLGLPGLFGCASPFPGAALPFCFALPPPGSGCPFLGRLVALPLLPLFPSPPPFFSRPLCLSLCALTLFVFPAWPLAALWWLLPPPPPPVLFLAVFLAVALCSVFFCFSCCASPLSLAFVGFSPRVPWALALCAFDFVGLPLLSSSCAVASFVVPAWLLAAPWWLLPPPPPCCVSLFLSLPLCAPFCFFFFFVFSFSLRAPVVSSFLWFPALGALGLGACVLVFLGLPGVFWGASPSPGAALPFCFALPPLGWGCPFPGRLVALPLLPLSPSPPPFLSRPLCLLLSLVSGPGCLGPWRFVFLFSLPRPLVFLFCVPPLSPAFSGFRPRSSRALALCAIVLLASRFSALRALLPRRLLPGGCCPPPLFVSRDFRGCLSVFFMPPAVPRFRWFPAPDALGCGAVACLFCWPPASLLSVRSPLVCRTSPLSALWWLLPPPPPPFVALFSSPPLGVPFFVFFALSFHAPVLPFPPVAGFLWFPAQVFFFSRFSARCALSPLLCLPPSPGLLPGVSCPPAPPPSLFVSRGFRHCLPALGFFCCAPPLSPPLSGFRTRMPWALALYGVFFPRGWLWCPVFCFVLRRVLFSCGPWRVLCCAWCCVLCWCLVGFLRRVVLGLVVLFLLCSAVVRCCVLCRFFFFFALFLAFPCCSGLFRFPCSACALRCRCACGVALCALLSCPCGAGWCFVLLSVGFACLLLGLAVLCCLLVGPGGSWCRVSVVCCGVSLRAMLPRVAACSATWRCVVVRCVVSFRSAWCCRALCRVLGRCPLSCGPVPSALCFVLSRRAVCVLCGVLLTGVVRRCALCRVRPLVSCCAFPILPALCGVAVRPCSPLVPCSPVLCPVVLCCRVVLWCPVLFAVFVLFLLLVKPLQNLFL